MSTRRVSRWVVMNLLPPIVAAVALVVFWDLAVRVFDIKKFIAPSPAEIVKAMISDRADLLRACWLTGRAAVVGLCISILVGTSIGVLFAKSSIVRRGLYPYAIFLQTVPVVAFAPLLVLWIGYGVASVIAVTFVLSLFPIITNVTVGMLAVPKSYHELFGMYGATSWQRFWKLQFPFTVPHLITGIKVSAGLATIGAIVGEYFVGHGASGLGLGFMIRQAVDMNRTERLFAVVLLSTLLGVAMFSLTSLLAETVLKRWCRTD
ncbi:MAG: ABC transporter permease [Planctomycetales bacterium]|nr:ABC transporter permease [Planctomycetales bacterium]